MRRGLDARLLAGMEVDQLDLQPAPLRPALVHALEHRRPILALGAARAGVDLDIAVVGIRLARQQRGHLVALGALGERRQAVHALIGHRGVALVLGHADQLDGIVQLALDGVGGADRLVQPATLAHHLLRLPGIVPQRRILDAGVELVQPAQRAIPVQKAAEQGERGVDLIGMGLRFGAHGGSP